MCAYGTAGINSLQINQRILSGVAHLWTAVATSITLHCLTPCTFIGHSNTPQFPITGLSTQRVTQREYREPDTEEYTASSRLCRRVATGSNTRTGTRERVSSPHFRYISTWLAYCMGYTQARKRFYLYPYPSNEFPTVR